MDSRQCHSCGHELPADAPSGLCVPCLLRLGLPDQPPLAAAKPEPFGDYELLEVIARGGMGVVYQARQRSLDRIVALKLIVAGQFANETERKRFQFEAESAAQLEHPNIVPIYAIGEYEGRLFFSMKLVAGGSLAWQMTQSGNAFGRDFWNSINTKSQIHARQAAIAALMVKVARAIHFAHQHGIIHRDLKPSNILLDETGEPHVADFGIAKRVTADGSLTVTEAVLGSPYYMSPEQAAGQTRQVSTAADVYSLGVIL